MQRNQSGLKTSSSVCEPHKAEPFGSYRAYADMYLLSLYKEALSRQNFRVSCTYTAASGWTQNRHNAHVNGQHWSSELAQGCLFSPGFGRVRLSYSFLKARELIILRRKANGFLFFYLCFAVIVPPLKVCRGNSSRWLSLPAGWKREIALGRKPKEMACPATGKWYLHIYIYIPFCLCHPCYIEISGNSHHTRTQSLKLC